MKYPLITYEDNTEMTCSSIRSDDTVLVCVETPIPTGFKTAVYELLTCKWISNEGYSDEELIKWEKAIKVRAHVIIEIAREGWD